jgi:hypothetical protein
LKWSDSRAPTFPTQQDIFGVKKRRTPILKPFQGLIEVKTEKKNVSKSSGPEDEADNWETQVMPFL